MLMKSEGVSVIICCHNSARRLPFVIEHLLIQKVSKEILWEVIIVNNNSTDDTEQIAQDLYTKSFPVPLKIVYEKKLGLSHARRRGFYEAQYEYVCFVDDDNWVSEDWITRVYQTMAEQPEVGACGGKTDAVFEFDPPSWFTRFQRYFAVGEQVDKAGRNDDPNFSLWGAGLTVRNSAMTNLIMNYDFFLTDRKGKRFSAGGDSELCYALRLMGWKLKYDPNLSMQHFMPKGRINWHNLCKMFYGFGKADITLNLYRSALQNTLENKNGFTGTWAFSTFWYFYGIIRNPKQLIRALLNKGEGDPDVLDMEARIGAIIELFRLLPKYNQRKDQINRICWMNKANG
jgi:glycosyltransferase involved in cell wall biosynthesis